MAGGSKSGHGGWKRGRDASEDRKTMRKRLEREKKARWNPIRKLRQMPIEKKTKGEKKKMRKARRLEPVLSYMKMLDRRAATADARRGAESVACNLRERNRQIQSMVDAMAADLQRSYREEDSELSRMEDDIRSAPVLFFSNAEQLQAVANAGLITNQRLEIFEWISESERENLLITADRLTLGLVRVVSI